MITPNTKNENMKDNNKRIAEIMGVDLSPREKLIFRGGEEIPCNIKCNVMDEYNNKVSGPDCCPFSSVTECEYEANSYYLANNLPFYASCFVVSD
jgi:hypothetical protein